MSKRIKRLYTSFSESAIADLVDRCNERSKGHIDFKVHGMVHDGSNFVALVSYIVSVES